MGLRRDYIMRCKKREREICMVYVLFARGYYSPLFCSDFKSCSSILLRSISRSCAGSGDLSFFAGIVRTKVSSSFGAVYLLLTTILFVPSSSILNVFDVDDWLVEEVKETLHYICICR